MENENGSEGLLKISILKMFNEIHDMEFLERLHNYLAAKVTLDKTEQTFYHGDTV